MTPREFPTSGKKAIDRKAGGRRSWLLILDYTTYVFSKKAIKKLDIGIVVES
jgi:hypothetical protein